MEIEELKLELALAEAEATAPGMETVGSLNPAGSPTGRARMAAAEVHLFDFRHYGCSRWC
jgi:hypothetical protein